MRGHPRRAAVLAGVAIAVTASIARASSDGGRAAGPERIVVVAGGCESEPVDATALAAALRVEMVQEGVFTVDVAAPGSASDERPLVATVRLLPASCVAPEAVPGFEIADGATGRTVRSALAIADIDRGVRPRVAALVIAERLRASWADLAAVPATPPAPLEPAADRDEPAPASTVAPPGAQDLPARVAAARAAPRTAAPPALDPSAPEHVETSPAADLDVPRPLDQAGGRDQTPALHRFALGAVIEGRSFFGPTTGLVGPRALAVLPVSPSSALRVHVDAGVAWGTQRDTLGDVAVTLASGGAGLTAMAGRGSLRFELGPEIEVGWIWARGVPKGSGVLGSTAGAALGAASVLASLFAEIAPRWTGIATLDLGVAFSGVEARADTRSVADTSGLMVGVRAGLAYAF